MVMVSVTRMNHAILVLMIVVKSKPATVVVMVFVRQPMVKIVKIVHKIVPVKPMVIHLFGSVVVVVEMEQVVTIPNANRLLLVRGF